jgi:hypothetical protein
VDYLGLQIDVYAIDAQLARDIVDAIRDAIEGQSHIVGWDGEGREAVTRLYRITFTVDWFVFR